MGGEGGGRAGGWRKEGGVNLILIENNVEVRGTKKIVPTLFM